MNDSNVCHCDYGKHRVVMVEKITTAHILAFLLGETYLDTENNYAKSNGLIGTTLNVAYGVFNSAKVVFMTEKLSYLVRKIETLQNSRGTDKEETNDEIRKYIVAAFAMCIAVVDGLSWTEEVERGISLFSERFLVE
jgi:hypothetical protein